MTTEGAIKELEESLRQNQIMLKNPTMFFSNNLAVKLSQTECANRRIDVLTVAITALRAQQEAEKNEPLTNADRIRAMSDEELQRFLCSLTDCSVCRWSEPNGCILCDWLHQPSRGD